MRTSPMQLGGPLTVIDDVGAFIKELRDRARRIEPKLELALEAVPSLNPIADYMPWLIAAIGFLGTAIIIHAIKTARR